MADEPGKVWNPAAALKRMGGDHSLLTKMITFFIEDSESLMVSLEAAFASENFKESARAAHSLKGLCLNFDAFVSAEIAEMVETCCHGGDVALIQNQLQSLRESIQVLRSSLLEWPESTPGDCSAS